MVLVQAKVIDPTHLELAKPMAPNRTTGNVLVMIAESPDQDPERQEWLKGSSESLREAYGDSEPEYTPAMVREPNPGYGA